MPHACLQEEVRRGWPQLPTKELLWHALRQTPSHPQTLAVAVQQHTPACIMVKACVRGNQHSGTSQHPPSTGLAPPSDNQGNRLSQQPPPCTRPAARVLGTSNEGCAALRRRPQQPYPPSPQALLTLQPRSACFCHLTTWTHSVHSTQRPLSATPHAFAHRLRHPLGANGHLLGHCVNAQELQLY